MQTSLQHPERHLVSRIGWLRAAILGENDGIVSTASLIVGVAAAASATSEILLAGTAGLVAGAMSMAAGEYVSVSSQSDTEHADTERERRELVDQPEAERQELAAIYVGRGLEASLAALSPSRASTSGLTMPATSSAAQPRACLRRSPFERRTAKGAGWTAA